MGTTLVQFQSCSVCACLEPRSGFVTAKAALNSDRMKVSCSMVSPCNIIIMPMYLSIYGFFPLKWAVIRVEAALSIAHRLQPIQSRFKLVITITINILQLLLLHLCCLTMHWLQTPIIIIFIKATLAAYVKLRPSRGYFVFVHYFHQLSLTPIKPIPKHNALN